MFLLENKTKAISANGGYFDYDLKACGMILFNLKHNCEINKNKKDLPTPTSIHNEKQSQFLPKIVKLASSEIESTSTPSSIINIAGKHCLIRNNNVFELTSCFNSFICFCL